MGRRNKFFFSRMAGMTGCLASVCRTAETLIKGIPPLPEVCVKKLRSGPTGPWPSPRRDGDLDKNGCQSSSTRPILPHGTLGGPGGAPSWFGGRCNAKKFFGARPHKGVGAFTAPWALPPSRQTNPAPPQDFLHLPPRRDGPGDHATLRLESRFPSLFSRKSSVSARFFLRKNVPPRSAQRPHSLLSWREIFPGR